MSNPNSFRTKPSYVGIDNYYTYYFRVLAVQIINYGEAIKIPYEVLPVTLLGRLAVDIKY